MNYLIKKIKTLYLYFTSCEFSHKWEYFNNGLTRKCKICLATDITVGEHPSMCRKQGDIWVRTFNGKQN